MRREETRMAQAPLRLVQFTKSFYFGGTEVQVVELLRGLPASYRVQVSVLDAVGPLMEPIRKMGITPEEFSLRGSLARPNTLAQVIRMARWLKQERVELVHVHDFYATVLAVPAAKLAGTKVIVGRLDLAHWHGRVRRALLRGLTQMADHVVGNAEAIRGMLVEEEGISPEKITVIPNGLDIVRFDQRRRAGLQAPLPDTHGAPVVVHVANMNHPVKRQEDLLRALALVRRAGHTLHAFLVGDGPRRPEMEKLAGSLGLADRVHFLKHRGDVPAIYERADFGVLCSSAEGMSNAVMEGMAAGLPMVVTNVGGNPELVADGERGLVVPPLRPEALGEAFLQLLGDRERGRRMGARARAFVERELSLTRMVRRHDALYRRVARGE
ncbi:glycosyl transferase family 1 [Cystobacter fuscus]|uniref:Glycosyl transferase family 1 n=1 Tax=Cystobacter fuscus TaxID=43 RepID=A0A250JAM8_9BACT|nr:glycosyltransferase [Cystobacter fuscus]ATB40969.1 glycosyl transferase family 1 [Cystobacter fuscus]